MSHIYFIDSPHAPERNPKTGNIAFLTVLHNNTRVGVVHPSNIFAFLQAAERSARIEGEFCHVVHLRDMVYLPEQGIVRAPFGTLCWN